jgi:hypothetical protein
MKQKLNIAFTLAVIFTLLVTSLAMADDVSVDNDVFSPGNQATVNLSAVTNATVNTSAQIVVDYQGSKHLTPSTLVSFSVNVSQTHLPADYTVGDVLSTVPDNWNDTTDNFIAGRSSISFKAPSVPGSYSYSVKWDNQESTCLSSGDCLTGANAFNINLIVTALTNTPPQVSIIGVSEGASYKKGEEVPEAICEVTDAEDGDSSFPATLSAISGLYASDGIGEQTASCSFTDGGGLTAEASVTYAIVDPSAPGIGYVLTPSSPEGENDWYKSDVILTWSVSDPESPNSLQKTGCEDQKITEDQAETTYVCSATSAGGSAGPVEVKIKRDATPPSITAALDKSPAASGWFNVRTGAPTVSFTCEDDTSGVASCPSSHTFGEGEDQAFQDTAYDNAGNEASAGVNNVDVDLTLPSITISTPNGGTYLLNQVVAADYGCDDTGGSGVSSCVGPVAKGSAIDTGSVGSKDFIVDAADVAGNTSSLSTSYMVGYGLCVLYDQTKAHKSGSTVPIKLQLCDVNGVNYSASSVVVKASNPIKIDGSASSQIEDSGNANPDNNFRYDPTLGGTGGYIFNLSTKGLTSGTWKVPFAVDGIATPGYWVEFDVK